MDSLGTVVGAAALSGRARRKLNPLLGEGVHVAVFAYRLSADGGAEGNLIDLSCLIQELLQLYAVGEELALLTVYLYEYYISSFALPGIHFGLVISYDDLSVLQVVEMDGFTIEQFLSIG